MKLPLETLISFTPWARKITYHITTPFESDQGKCCLYCWMRYFLSLSKQTMRVGGVIYSHTHTLSTEKHWSVTYQYDTIIKPWKRIQHEFCMSTIKTSTLIDTYSIMNKGQWKAPSWPPGEGPSFFKCDWVNPLQARTGLKLILPCTWNTNTLSYTTTQQNRTLPLCVVTHIRGSSCSCFAPLPPFGAFLI